MEVALGVAILHRDIGKQIDDLEQRGRRDGEARALHMRSAEVSLAVLLMALSGDSIHCADAACVLRSLMLAN